MGIAIGLSLLLLTGCVMKEEKNAINCQQTKVDLVNYTEKGKRLKNCFVEYPKEASRQDKSYYIVEDICGQFTKEFMSRMMGRTILKSEKANVSGSYACDYFWNDRGDKVSLILDYINIENQKKGQEELGRKAVENKDIPMKNVVIYQENGLINTIYLGMSENKFISIERSASAGLTTEDLLNLAKKIALEIKNYK